MQIALAHSHPNTFGGGERALLELARGLATRHQITLLVGEFDRDHTYTELAAFPMERFRAWQWLLRRCAVDVVVSHSFGANLLALRNGGRVVYWVHSVRSLFLQPRSYRPDLFLRRTIDWVAVRRAARLVANSHFTAARLWALYRRTPDAVVYPGVDLELFQPTPTVKAAGYAVTVGRLSAEKGLDRLFELWHNMPDVPLHVVGDGDPGVGRRLRALAPPQVKFHGALPPRRVAEIYQSATLAVFTPRAEEFGIAPLEAMACGVPVVAWREGGLVETVVDGETGYLVADTDAFCRRVRLLRENPGLRHDLGQAARRRAEEFSWARTVASMEQLCVEVAAESKSV